MPGGSGNRTTAMNVANGIASEAARRVTPRHPERSNGRSTIDRRPSHHLAAFVSALRSRPESDRPDLYARIADAITAAVQSRRNAGLRVAPPAPGSSEYQATARYNG